MYPTTSDYEMELMIKANNQEFGINDSYDPIAVKASLNTLILNLERQKHRAEAVQKMKNTVMAWLQSFQKRSVARA